MRSDFDVLSTWELKTYEDYVGLAEAIIHCWDNHYGRATLSRYGTLTLITGGWSDNEHIQFCVESNRFFNMACWESSHRGGKVIYKLPKRSCFRVDKKTMQVYNVTI